MKITTILILLVVQLYAKNLDNLFCITTQLDDQEISLRTAESLQGLFVLSVRISRLETIIEPTDKTLVPLTLKYTRAFKQNNIDFEVYNNIESKVRLNVPRTQDGSILKNASGSPILSMIFYNRTYLYSCISKQDLRK